MRHLLITGEPGVGKSTMVAQVLDPPSSNLDGFYTEQVLELGERVGFRAHTLSGMSYMLAHKRAFPLSFPVVGNYRVNVSLVRDVLCPLILDAVRERRPLIIDEIGPMQLLAEPHFASAILAALNRDVPTIATVHSASHPFTNVLKWRDDIVLWNVTEENRWTYQDQLVHWIDMLQPA